MTEPSISFGRNAEQEHHAFRHIAAAGLDLAKVRQVVLADLELNKALLFPGIQRRTVQVEGVWIEYAAFRFEDESINIGRIIIVRSGGASAAP